MVTDCGCDDDPVIVNTNGAKGDQGFNGWSPLLAIVSDGARRVLQITGWTGGTGTEPSFTNQYIGAAGIVQLIADAVDIRGATGATGTTGTAGDKGWSPILAVVTDSARKVLQVVDWTGGAGTKPSVVNQFIGAVGIVSSAAAAVDIRGATGATGSAGTNGTDVTDGRVKVTSNDTTLGYLLNKLISSDSTVAFTEVNDAGDEDLSISTKSVVSDQYAAVFSGVGTSYADVFTYTTPNDGLTRKYKVDFSAVGYIAEVDGTGRESVINFALYIDGSLIKEKVFDVYSRSGSSISQNDFTLQYAGAVLPNKVIAIKVKKTSESPGGGNTVRITYKSLSIFGIL